MTTYSAAVEKWRPLVAQYFQPEDVDKALYVINGESRGNPSSVGDGGASGGLFQLNNGGLGAGMTDAQKFNAETNIKTAATAVYGGSGWKPWGEGSSFQGKPFGALGNAPYGGGSSGSSPSATNTARAAQEKRLADLSMQFDTELANPPPQQDANGDPTRYNQWVSKMNLLDSQIKSLNTTLGRADTSFANDIASQNQGIKIDELNQNRDSKEIDRFLNGLQESRGRAQEIAAAKKQLIEYGAPQGKTSFSYADLGGEAAADAKRRGIDVNTIALNYSGQTYLDPQGDMSNYDKMFGVSGQIPSMGAPRTQYDSIPQQGGGGGGYDRGQDPGTDPATLGAAFSSDPMSGSQASQHEAFGDPTRTPPPWTPNYTPYQERGSMGASDVFNLRGIGGGLLNRFTSRR